MKNQTKANEYLQTKLRRREMVNLVNQILAMEAFGSVTYSWYKQLLRHEYMIAPLGPFM